MYQAGDIIGVRKGGLTGFLSREIFWPHTDLFHFLLVWFRIPKENDYVILESVSKGIAVGRLSWYKEYTVFRPQAGTEAETKRLGKKACIALTKHGRAHYDFLLIAKLVIGVILVEFKVLLREHRLRAISPSELPYTRDSHFICTEAVAAAWRAVGFPIIPKGVCPLPAGYLKAAEQGRLKML